MGESRKRRRFQESRIENRKKEEEEGEGGREGKLGAEKSQTAAGTDRADLGKGGEEERGKRRGALGF